MSVTFTTEQPAVLLKAFDDRIQQSEPKGKITTWEKLPDGVHYTHKAAEWKRKAFFKPSVETGKLVFNIIKPQDVNVSTLAYGYYHGHLIETFLNHFDSQFSTAGASAYPATGDFVK